VAAGRVIAVQLNMANPWGCPAARASWGRAIAAAGLLLLGAILPANAATPAGTVIENYATLQYDGGSIPSNVVRISVAQVAGVSLQPTSAAVSGLPARSVFFPVTLTNTGNGSDSFSISVASNSNWPSAAYRDDNNDGIHQDSEQTVISTAGNVALGGTFHFFAAVTIPVASASGLLESVTVTARSNYDSAVAASASYSVRVEQSVGMSLSPAQALVTAQPGSRAYLPFVISNTGNTQNSAALSVSCDRGWPTAIIADANQDGIHQTEESAPLTSVGPLAPAESRRAFVEVQVPADLAAETQANLLLTAIPGLDASKTAQASYIVVGKVALAGDVDEDGRITSLDVDAAAQMAVGAGLWSAPQRDKADVNRDGTVDLLDVLRLLSLSSGQQMQSFAVTGRQLTLPQTKAPAGFSKKIEIGIDNGAQVAGVQAVILLDTDLLSASKVSAGSLMGTDANWEILYAVAGSELRLLAYNSSGRSLASGAGSVLEIALLSSPTAQAGDQSPLVWAEALASDPSGTAILPLQTVDGAFTVEAPAAISVQVCKQVGGTPIAGARVEAWQEGELAASGVSDTSGDCLLSPLASGSYDIHVTAAGFYRETLPEVMVGEGETATAGLDLVVISKANTGAIEGIVLNQAGQPLRRAAVSLYRNGRKITTAYTDASGYYCKTALAPGTYTAVVQLRGYAKVSTTVTVYANEMTYADFLLLTTAQQTALYKSLKLT